MYPSLHAACGMNEPTSRVHFDNAPVVEMVQALFFAPVVGWDLLDFGLLWQRFASNYSRHEFKPPLGEPPQLQNQFLVAVQKQDLGKFPVRCWFIDKSETELAQIQDSCFIHNWRKVPSTDTYPGFDNIRLRFLRDWRLFREFLDDRGFPGPDVWKTELTYIDQFVRGEEWSTFADLPKIYRLWRGMEAEGPLSAPEYASFTVNYALSDATTRLVFSSQPAVRPVDGKEVIQLTVTATGRPASSTDSDVSSWFDAAHASLIEGFVNFTTPEAHAHWRRTR